MVNSIIEPGSEFAIAYGLQLIGALVILLIGLRIAGFFGRRITALCERRNLDVTLSRFADNVVKIILVVIVVIINLSNFGIDIAPLVALGGAAAFDNPAEKVPKTSRGAPGSGETRVSGPATGATFPTTLATASPRLGGEIGLGSGGALGTQSCFGVVTVLPRGTVEIGAHGFQLFGFQPFDLITQIGGFLEFQISRSIVHALFQFGDIGLQVLANEM